VKVTTKKIDDANVLVSGTLDGETISKTIDKLAKEAAKQIKVDGFRPGKVPVHVVKKMHGEKLAQDAEAEALRELIDAGIKEAGIDAADMIGQPTFKKYDKKEDGSIDVEVEISVRPNPELEGYMDLVPQFEKPKADEKEVEAKLEELAKENAPYEKLKRKRMLKEGDLAVIDFEGFVDGEPFEGGKAENFELKIGSGQFIPGFEEQLIGMKYDEEKTIDVKFPEEYPAAELAGKETQFKVKLHEIKAPAEPKVDDALAKKLLNDENATLDTLKEKVTAQIETAELSRLYNEEIKPKLVEALVEKYDFALPNNIVEQEIDAKINAKAREMSEEELKSYQENPEKVDELRESVREDAEKSVKATFIVDALAKKEGIEVDDQEVSQAIYYEAMMSGQDPQQVIKYYQENNLLPAIKMGMIEDKLFGKMLGLEEK
jgi:trigger factor